MRYYQFLCDQSCPLNNENPLRIVTSAQIAKALERDQTLVRKDFASIGIIGQPRVGFSTVEVCSAIRRSLGFDGVYPAVLVGAGHLGGALLAYPGFHLYGLSIAAAFDSDGTKVGTKVGGCTIRAMATLRSFIRQHDIKLGILTTPADEAQELADRLIEAGVKAIWNFTPAKLRVPEKAFVRNEQISLGLAELAYRLKGHVQRPRVAGQTRRTPRGEGRRQGSTKR
jgi:redox-sensing transcriptional repressor